MNTQERPPTAVFISYSRADAEFVRRLATALEASGYSPIYDQAERAPEDPELRLTAQDEWWKTLKGMIAASDVMVFIVSPQSAASHVCDDEIAHAKSLGKRVIAANRRDIDFDTAPERLRALNVRIDFRSDADSAFSDAFARLCAELDVDIEWHRRGAYLMRLANRWDAEGRPEGQLLRSGAISDADGWAARRPKGAEGPGPLLLDFLQVSRSKEDADRRKLRRATGLAFLRAAQTAMERQDRGEALRWAVAGALIADDPSLELMPELSPVIRRVLYENAPPYIMTHSMAVSASAIIAAPSFIVTCGYDNAIYAWNTRSNTRKLLIDGLAGAATQIEVAQDGRFVVVAARPGPTDIEVIIWDTAEWRVVSNIKFNGEKAVLRIFGQEVIAVVGRHKSNRYQCHFIDLTTGKARGEFSIDIDHPVDLLFSQSGRLYVHGHYAAYELLRDDQKCIERFTGRIIAAAISNEDLVVCERVGEDCRLRGSMQSIAGRVFQNVGACSFSEDGAFVALAQAKGSIDGGWIDVLDLATGVTVAKLQNLPAKPTKIVVRKDANRVISLFKRAAPLVWVCTTGKRIAKLEGHADSVWEASISGDGRHVLTHSTDGSARLWRVLEDREIARFAQSERTPVNAIAWSPDGRSFVSGGDDRLAILWDVDQGKRAGPVMRHGHRVNSLKFAINGKYLISGSHDDQVKIWPVDNFSECWASETYGGRVFDATLSRSGRLLAVARSEGHLTVTDRRTGNAVIELWYPTNRDMNHYLYRVAFSPDEGFLAAAVGAKIFLIEVSTAKTVATFSDHERHVDDIAFSGDGAHFASAGTNGVVVRRFPDFNRMVHLSGMHKYADTVQFCFGDKALVAALGYQGAKIWRLEDGAELDHISPPSEAECAAVSPDGSRLLVGTAEGGIHLYDVSRTSELAAGRTIPLGLARLSAGLEQWQSSDDPLLEIAPRDLVAAAKEAWPTFVEEALAESVT